MAVKQNFAVAAVAAGIVLALSNGAAFAKQDYVGTWHVKDTKDKDFDIVVAADGSAMADRSGEALKGNWVEEGRNLVINWNGSEGWKTKIEKHGKQFKKTAYHNGAKKGTSAAEKVK